MGTKGQKGREPWGWGRAVGQLCWGVAAPHRWTQKPICTAMSLLIHFLSRFLKVLIRFPKVFPQSSLPNSLLPLCSRHIPLAPLYAQVPPDNLTQWSSSRLLIKQHPAHHSEPLPVTAAPGMCMSTATNTITTIPGHPAGAHQRWCNLDKSHFTTDDWGYVDLINSKSEVN